MNYAAWKKKSKEKLEGLDWKQSLALGGEWEKAEKEGLWNKKDDTEDGGEDGDISFWTETLKHQKLVDMSVPSEDEAKIEGNLLSRNDDLHMVEGEDFDLLYEALGEQKRVNKSLLDEPAKEAEEEQDDWTFLWD